MEGGKNGKGQRVIFSQPSAGMACSQYKKANLACLWILSLHLLFRLAGSTRRQ